MDLAEEYPLLKWKKNVALSSLKCEHHVIEFHIVIIEFTVEITMVHIHEKSSSCVYCVGFALQ